MNGRSQDPLKDIDEQIKDIKSFKLSKKQEAYFAKYPVAVICGSFEHEVEKIIMEYVNKFPDERLSRFTEKSMHRLFRTPSIEKIKEILQMFDKNWAKNLCVPNKAKTAIQSIIAHKNELAHLGNTNITLDEIEQSYIASKEVLNRISEVIQRSS